MSHIREVKDGIRTSLPRIISCLNDALGGGKALTDLALVLERLGRGGKLPHWYSALRDQGILPNLDGKSMGSVLEMLFVAVLETKFYSDSPLVPFKVNPARGVDIPDLQLGIKSPSENYSTSEPFFSAYERLLGNEHDAVILLTDYQTQKAHPPLKVRIINYQYLRGSQIADFRLCGIARCCRTRMRSRMETELKKAVRFLAYINQSDWEARRILRLLTVASDDEVERTVACIRSEYERAIEERSRTGRELLPEGSIRRIEDILQVSPHILGVINAADNWVIEIHKDFGRYPNDNEWERFMRSPLDGQIGMSYALQWRYNFGRLFR